jgi:peptidase M23-like protein
MTRFLLALGTLLVMASQAHALEVQIAPGDFLVLNPTNPNRGYSDVILHALGVRAGETCQLRSVKIEVMAKGQARLTEDLPLESLLADTHELATQPVPAAIGAQLLDAHGADGMFKAPTTFAATGALRPGQAVFAVRRHYSVGFAPDQVRVSATCGTAFAQAVVAVKPYRSPIAYRFPLQGLWLMQSVPVGVDSHHRLNPSTEFASDFFKIDAEGRQYKGDRMQAAAWYAWGQPVLAAADGVVTRVIAGQVQDRAAFAPHPGETPQQAGQRMEAAGVARLRADFAAANAGNLIVIRHEAAGSVEYSAYGHLKPGSVGVKVGDRVVQGQKIAEVGDTGDTPVVHLHFQINAGPDPFFDRSLPVVFADLRLLSGPEVGRVVAAP